MLNVVGFTLGFFVILFGEGQHLVTCGDGVPPLTPIQSITVSTDSPDVATDQPFNLTVTIDPGQPSVLLDVEIIQIGNGKVVDRLSIENIDAVGQGNITHVSLNISEYGSHQITVNVSNSLSSKSASCTVFANVPILTYWVEDPTPIRYLPSSIIVISVIQHMRDQVTDQIPTNVWIEHTIPCTNITVNANYTQGPAPSIPPFAMNYGILLAGGVYSIPLRAYNDVSERTTIMTLMLLEDIEEMTLNSYPTEESGDLREDLTYFVNTTVKFNCSVERGTVQWITWKIPSIGVVENGSCEWNYTFWSVGTFLVEVTASNLFTLVRRVESVTVVKPVMNLLLVNERHAMVGEEVSFVLFVENLREDSIVTVSFGDGQSVNNLSFSINMSLSECNTSRPGLTFDPCLSYSSLIKHTYYTPGNFIAEAKDWNPEELFSSMSEIIVSKQAKVFKGCEIYVFDIGGGEVNTSARVLRNQTIKLQANVVTENQTNVANLFGWKVYKINETLSEPDTGTEVRFGENVPQNLLNFHIPAYFLEIGEYTAEFEVTSDHQQYGTNETTCLEQIVLEVVSASDVTKSTDVFSILVSQYAKEGHTTTFTFQSDFVSEPDIRCLWNFGDGTPVSLYNQEDLSSPVTHVFSSFGQYLLQASCFTSQGFNRSATLVQVNPSLGKLTCNLLDEDGYSSSVILIGARNLTITYNTDFENVFYRVLYNGKVQPVDDTVLLNSEYLEGSVVISQQTQLSLGPGNHSFTLMVTGYDLGKQCTFEVEFQEPIYNMTASISMTVVATNVTFDLLVKFYKGYPVTLKTEILKDGNSTCEINMKENREDSYEWFILVPLLINEPGLHVISVQASNSFSLQTTELNVSVQVPLTSLHVVTPPATHYMGDIVHLSIVLYIQPVNPAPTDLYLDLTYGDGRRDVSPIVWYDDHRRRKELNITYLLPGIYSAKVHLFNNVSDLWAPVTVLVLQDIEGASVFSHSERGVAIAGTEFYPLELPVSFNCSVQNGTMQWVTWKIADLPDLNVTSCDSINHTFSTPGVTIVSANIQNVLSQQTGFKNFTMMESISDLHLVNNGPVNLDVDVVFVLFMKTVGTESSYTIDFGDGESMTITNITRDPDVGQYLKQGFLLPFNSSQQYSSVISHGYSMDGHFMAVANGWNKVSFLSSLSHVYITLRPCEIPLIQILGGTTAWTTATKLFKYQAFTLRANITVNCQGSDETIYRWRIFRISDTFPFPSIANEVLFDESVKRNLVELFIPAYTLEYGDYVLEISVTSIMKRTGETGMARYNQTYLRVVALPLVPRITGGSLRHLSWYSEILVDGSSSYDPDRPPSNKKDQDLVFSWYCRKANESFPDDLSGNPCKRCGCFNSGFAITDDPSLKIVASSSLFIPAQTLEGNKSYTILLEVSKPGREAVTVEQEIKLLPGDIPSVLIRCIQNCGPYLNPSERFVLSGKCEDCTEFTRPRYEWDLIPASMESSLQKIDWEKDTTTGKFNAYLVFRGGVFAASASEGLTLKLTTFSWAGTSNYAEFMFKINSPPTRGTCFIAPSVGVVLLTYFHISCHGFYDVDTPLMYETRAMTSTPEDGRDSTDYVTGSLLHFGYDPLFPPTPLPVGSPSENHLLYVEVVVKDAFGASSVTVLNVTVNEPSEQESLNVFNQALNLTQGEDSEMKQLLLSGDTQAATQLITTVSSLLNSETEKQEKSSDDSNKETRIQVREQLITDLNKVELHDLESLQLTSAAVVEVTQEEAEISASAQLSASAMYQKMGTFLMEQSTSGASTVAVEGTARQLVSGLSNILGAASSHLVAVTNETIRKQDESSENETATVTQNTRNITLTALQTLKEIEIAILHSKVPREEGTLLETSHVEILLNRHEKWELDDKVVEVPGHNNFFKLPQDFREELDSHSTSSDTSYDSILDTHVRHFTENPYAWSNDMSVVTSHVVALEFAERENETLALKNLTSGVDILLENNIQEKTVTLDDISNPKEDEKIFGFNITENITSVMMHVKLQGKGHVEADASVTVWVFYESVINYTRMFSVSLPKEDGQEIHLNESYTVTSDPYSFLFEGEIIQEEGSYYIKIEVDGSYMWIDDWDVEVLVYRPQCLYWDADLEIWASQGCKVGPVTSLHHIHCICHHLSTFAGGFIPLPNAINFKEDVLLFTEIFENPVTAVTVVTVILLFSLTAIWARRRDRQEEKEVEVIYLADNDTTALYEYHVTVITGMRRGSGTSATVTLTLYGTQGSSDPHVLVAPHRPVLQRGSPDSFMITTFASLGELTAIRLWHDNSGSHPEWYVSRIIVHDLQSNGWWYFLCQSWLAISMREFSIDKTFPVATPEDLTQFHHLFLSKMQRDIKNEHLWISVVMRSPYSTFTRLQRAACCLCIVMSAMLTNIIFYGVPEKYSTNENNISFGSLSLSWTSVVIGVESSLITFPMNYAIVEFFRNSRVRPSSSAESLQSSEFTFSSFSQITLQSAYSNLSSLYQSCKIFFSDSSKSSSQSLSTRTSSPGGSGLSEGSSKSLDSTTLLLGHEQSSSNTESLSVFANENRPVHPEKDNSEEMLTADRWICLDSKETLLANHNEGYGLDINCEEEDFKIQEVPKVGDRRTDVTENELNRVCAWKDDLNTAENKDRIKAEDENDVWSSLEEYQKTMRTSLDGAFSKHKTADEKKLVTESDLSGLPSQLKVNNDLEDAEMQQRAPFYPTHKDYLSLKLNEIRQEMETMPELLRSEVREKGLAGKKLDRVLLLHGWMQEGRQSEEGEKEENAREKYVEFQGCFPWWFIYISWCLVFLTCLTCSFFIILYGLRYGKQQSLDWLVAMFVSLFQSITVIQPVKVVVTAALIAIVLPSHKHDEIGLGTSRIVNAREVISRGGNLDIPLQQLRKSHYYTPPPAKRVEKAHQKRLAQAKIYSMLKALLGQIAFIFLVLEIAYMQRDPNTFLMNQALQNAFTEDIEEIRTSDDLMEWMRESFVPVLFGGDDGFMEDDLAFRVGGPRIRQLRYKSDPCKIHPLMKPFVANCRSTPDTNSYNASWVPSDTFEKEASPWVYQPAAVLQGSFATKLTSGSQDRGGYSLYLGTTLESAVKQLNFVEEQQWIDNRTRAVFIEWNMFNPHTNLLCICSMLFEKLATGPFMSSFTFDIMRPLDMRTPYDKISLSLESVYIVVIFVLILIEVQKYRKHCQTYWDYWNLMTAVIIFLSLLAAVVYILWLIYLWDSIQNYVNNKDVFWSFFTAAYINQIFNYLVAYIVFLSSLKCAKILRYNRSIHLMQMTLHFLSRKFSMFLLVVCITFLSVSGLAYLWFGCSVYFFYSLTSSLESIFLFISGGFAQFLEVVEDNPITGPIFFILMTFALIYIFMNLLVMFIVESFMRAKVYCDQRVDDRDVVRVFIEWFLSCIGFKGSQSTKNVG